MKGLPPIQTGIIPSGALGVSFFYHLTREATQLDGRVCFLEQPGSQSGAELRAAGFLTIESSTKQLRLPMEQVSRPSLRDLATSKQLPRIVLWCPNPDQLLHSLTVWVEILEDTWASQRREMPLDVSSMPAMVLCSNGIYFQRLRQVLIEKLEESTLLGRLPDLWPTLMPQIVGRLIRGVTIQTGIREGAGGRSIYKPGPPGTTKLAGGDAALRNEVHQILTDLGGWFEMAESASPTRVEFEKAMVNLVANLLGQLAAIRDDGIIEPLTLNEVLHRTGPLEIESLTRHVLEVGKAVRAYSSDEAHAAIHRAVLENVNQHRDHIPSSIQWLDMEVRAGRPPRDLTPTEQWLLDPLLHYARSAGLTETIAFFENLRQKLRDRLALLRN